MNDGWDNQIKEIESRLDGLIDSMPDAIIGVPLDDWIKKAYFVPRLQKMLNENPRAVGLTFKVIPWDGSAALDVRRQ